jgi:hypothetical protein
MSRVFEVPGRGVCFAPVIDLLNHGAFRVRHPFSRLDGRSGIMGGAQGEYVVETEHGRHVVTTPRALAPGDPVPCCRHVHLAHTLTVRQQVELDYGKSSSSGAHLLLNYGFVLADNPFDYVPLSVDTAGVASAALCESLGLG